MSNTFTFGGNLKKSVLGLAVVGLVLGVVLGFFLIVYMDKLVP